MPRARPTILFLVTEDWYFVSHRLALAEAAVAAGFRVVVACRVEAHGEIIEAAGCELRPLAWKRSGNTAGDHRRAWVELLHLYREVQPDIAHHVALKPVVLGGLAARWIGGTRVVSAVAGLGFVFASSTWRARMLRLVLQPVLALALRGEHHRVIVQNRDDQDRLVQSGLVPAAQVVLIRGAGVPPEVFRPGPPAAGPPIVVLVARMLWDKGVGEFVEAARAVHSRGTQARFLLVGQPDPDNPSSIPQSVLEGWQRDGHVEWLGSRSDVPAILAEASIFCLPTRYGEGIPRSLLEAAAAGLAIVATDAPGCREVVQHGVTGLLVPPGDQGALEATLVQLLADAGARDRLGSAARTLVEQEFSLAHVIGATLDLYRGLLA